MTFVSAVDAAGVPAAAARFAADMQAAGWAVKVTRTDGLSNWRKAAFHDVLAADGDLRVHASWVRPLSDVGAGGYRPTGPWRRTGLAVETRPADMPPDQFTKGRFLPNGAGLARPLHSLREALDLTRRKD